MGKEMSKSGEDRRGSSVPNENFSMEEGIQKYLNLTGNIKFGEKALQILKIASYFTSSIIEKDIFSSLMSNEQELKEVLKLLEKHSLIELYWETGVFSVEEKVGEKVRSFLFENKQEESVLKSAFELFSGSPGSEKMVVHITSVLSFAKKYPDLLEENSSVLFSILNGLISSMDLAEAFLLGSEAFEVLKESLGEYNMQTLQFQKTLAKLSLLCDNLDKALTLSTDLYEKESKIVGNKTCTTTLELIAKLKLTVKKPESERQLRELVFGEVPVSETKNNSVLDIWDKYALILVQFDLLDEALEICNEILKRRCEILGPDDDDIDEVNVSIVAVYSAQKDYTKGLELAENIRKRRKERYGEFSLKAISAHELLGQMYVAQEMNDKALSVYEDVREKVRHVAGKSSIYYRALAQLGKIYFILNEFEKSYKINSELYEKRKADKGDNDDICFALKQNMLSCLIGQEKSSEAAELYTETLKWCLETYGLVNSKTLKWGNFLETKGLTYTYCQI